MSKNKYLFPVLLLLGAGTVLSARHHNEGLHLAAEIVGLVRTAVAPPPVVVAAPPPRVVAPPPPRVVVPPPRPVVIPNYGYGWWQGVWVPCYQSWYWYNGAWVWGGRGPRPVPPAWAPDPHRRPVPPPPVHHRPAPPPRVHHPAPPPRVHHPAPAPRHHQPGPGPQGRPGPGPRPGYRR